MFPDAPDSVLSGIFSTMTTLNSVVAILAGVIAEWVVDLTGTEKAPFMTAIICLMLAAAAIWKNWVGFIDEELWIKLMRCRERIMARQPRAMVA